MRLQKLLTKYDLKAIQWERKSDTFIFPLQIEMDVKIENFNQSVNFNALTIHFPICGKL